MAVPDYGKINGPVLTNGNRHYKVYEGTDSKGNPGKWNVYYDGEKNFISDASVAQREAEAAARAQAEAAAAAAAAAAQAAAAAAAQTGGAAAPAAPVPAEPAFVTEYTNKVDSKGRTGVFHVYPDGRRVWVPKSEPNPALAASANSPDGPAGGTATAGPVSDGGAAPAPAPASDGHNWITNTNRGSDMYGKKYWVEPGKNGKNEEGKWHHYEGGKDVFIKSGGSDDGNELVAVGPLTTSSTTVSDTSAGNVSETKKGSTAVASGSGGSYTVSAGDTLSGIAKANGMSLSQIKELNPQIKNASLIHPGQKINLGGWSDSGTSSTGGTDFLTASTYPPTLSGAAGATDKPANAGGLSNGTSGVAADPVNIATAVGKIPTDPFGMNHGKKKKKDDSPITGGGEG